MEQKELTTGKQIKRLREIYKLSPEDFSRHLGVTTEYLTGIENGNENPPDQFLKLISIKFKIPVDYLKTGHEASGETPQCPDGTESSEKESYVKRTEIGIDEDALCKMLKDYMFYENIDIYGDEMQGIMDSADTYMEKKGFDFDTVFELDEFIRDTAVAAGDHAFDVGFREGVRLFRTLMKL